MKVSYADINQALIALSWDLLGRKGSERDSRNGKVRELTFVNFSIENPLEREIRLAERKHSIVAQIAETMWVLSGSDDIEWLGRYLPRAKDFSDDGKTWRGAYGKRLRKWPRRDGSGDVIDQLRYVVDLLKKDPDSRQAVMTIFDPVVDTAPGKDIPCNNWLHFLIRDNQLHLHVAVRSNDLIWGWSGINYFEWSTLLEVVASLLNVEVGKMHFSISSLHVYEPHWKRARNIMWAKPVQANRLSSRMDPLPSVDHLDSHIEMWMESEQMIREGKIPDQYVYNRCASFPDPMLRSWLFVIAYYWRGNEMFLGPIRGTALAKFATTVEKKKQPPVKLNVLEEQPPVTLKFNVLEVNTSALDAFVRGEGAPAPTGIRPSMWREEFIDYVTKLHSEKHAAYGDSWKKRGEMLSILANIARKVDRLGVSDNNESDTDTAIDLFVYLAKYRDWFSYPERTDDGVNEFIRTIYPRDLSSEMRVSTLIETIREQFNLLWQAAESRDSETVRLQIVEEMILLAGQLAYHTWRQEKWREGNKTRSWNPGK